ncbi:unnamed protein product [Mytilus coruscus]|uniref:Uncharacterized protein n=1 Tax=Mytilus coruscus TaxID=42192 RepID=A0A6J8C8K4_MYTCO|nr:unnamed protein product [Mytilus coruscus]
MSNSNSNSKEDNISNSGNNSNSNSKEENISNSGNISNSKKENISNSGNNSNSKEENISNSGNNSNSNSKEENISNRENIVKHGDNSNTSSVTLEDKNLVCSTPILGSEQSIASNVIARQVLRSDGVYVEGHIQGSEVNFYYDEKSAAESLGQDLESLDQWAEDCDVTDNADKTQSIIAVDPTYFQRSRDSQLINPQENAQKNNGMKIKTNSDMNSNFATVTSDTVSSSSKNRFSTKELIDTDSTAKIYTPHDLTDHSSNSKKGFAVNQEKGSRKSAVIVPMQAIQDQTSKHIMYRNLIKWEKVNKENYEQKVIEELKDHKYLNMRTPYGIEQGTRQLITELNRAVDQCYPQRKSKFKRREKMSWSPKLSQTVIFSESKKAFYLWKKAGSPPSKTTYITYGELILNEQLDQFQVLIKELS